MNTPTPPISDRYPAPVRRALQQLDAAGVKRSMSAPPLYRLFWRLGWGVAPPILTGFVGNVLTTGAWFAVGWGVAMWLMLWRNTGLTVVGMATIAVIAGLAFGVLMALMLRYQRQRLGLPLWKDLT